MYICPVIGYRNLSAPKTQKKQINNPNFKSHHFAPHSYEKFIQHMYLNGLRQSLGAQCIEENILGRGANSIVYKFSSPSMKNWAIKVNNKHKDVIPQSFLEPIIKTEDEFGDLNKGQAVAQIGQRISILKRIEGEPHSIKNWSARRSSGKANITREEANKFFDDVVAISEFPKESYVKYAEELKSWHEHGYKLDSFNPNNYLIDYKNKKIHILDPYKYNNEYRWNSKFDLICPLLDYANYEQYFTLLPKEKQVRLKEAGLDIFYKCSKASQQTGIPSSESLFTDFISTIDRREKYKNKYYECYIMMKDRLGLSF